MNDYLFAFQENEAKYKQIYRKLKKLIEEGIIIKDEELPSIRKLAESLKVSRNTTLSAYEQLVAEGYIRGEAKRGFYVNAIEPNLVIENGIVSVEENIEERNVLVDFRTGAVDQLSFPLANWRKYSNDVLKASKTYTYGVMQGEEELRLQLKAYLLSSRGFKPSIHNMVIGSSTQQQLLQLSFLLQKNFPSIFLENPGYNGARDVFAMQQFQIEPLSVTEQGFNLHQLHDRTRLAYVTPSHQFPYGVSMPIRERQLLLNWATKVEGYIIEEDYDSEFRYKQQPYPALASIDSRRVIYMGTFSKAFLPAIRLSYMVLPDTLMSEYKKYFSTFENTASRIHQLTMASFMEAGDWERHIRRMRLLYKRKMHFLVSTLSNIFNTKITIIGEQSGLYVLIRIHTNTPENILIKKALNHGVKVYPTTPYFIKDVPSEPILQLGFANLTNEEIENGIILLANAWQL